MGRPKKKFKYNGKLLTFKELLQFSVVPEKTLHSRLHTSNSLWEVEKALKTPFGKKGKTSELSKANIDTDENKHNKNAVKGQAASNHMHSNERGTNEGFFSCVLCGFTKNIKCLGKKARKGFICTSCVTLAEKRANRTEQEIKIKQAQYKRAGKQYKEDKANLFFITNEEQDKKK